MTENTAQYLSTAEAARMLGLSTTLVQTLVDKDELKGWKTRGGHRRIALSSILEYQRQAGQDGGAPRQPCVPQITLVLESDHALSALQSACAQWRFPVEVKFVDSVTAALLNLTVERPDMLLVAMTMPRSQQERTLQALDQFNARGRPISMVLVTDEKDLQRPEASPHAQLIQVVSGPLSELWLHAFLTGVVACLRR